MAPKRKAASRTAASKAGSVAIPAKASVSKKKEAPKAKADFASANHRLAVKVEFPEFECEIDSGTPRRGAFEITLFKAGSSEPVLLWTGLKKGPPRKLKFPEASIIIDSILSQLSPK